MSDEDYKLLELIHSLSPEYQQVAIEYLTALTTVPDPSCTSLAVPVEVGDTA